MIKINKGSSLGVSTWGSHAVNFIKTSNPYSIKIQESKNGFDFISIEDPITIKNLQNRKERISNSRYFILNSQNGIEYLTYLRLNSGQSALCLARLEENNIFQKIAEMPEIDSPGTIIPDYHYQGNSVLIFGTESLKIAFSKDLVHWEIQNEEILQLNTELTSNGQLQVANIFNTSLGILVIYFFWKKIDGKINYSLRAAYFDKSNPKNQIIRLHQIIWQQDENFPQNLNPIGLAKIRNKIFSYWLNDKNEMTVINHDRSMSLWHKIILSFYPLLEKLKNNPLLKPTNKNFWESLAVFNPAVVVEDGKVHLVYRAVGDDYQSVWGHAISLDGENIIEKSNQPIFHPSLKFKGMKKLQNYCSLQYLSGGQGGAAGGGGGCEDPRLTQIGDRIYALYVAYNGWSAPRLAITSIKTEDFINEKWNWKEPVLISKPNTVDKSGSLLPEKINGKYVIFHRVFPDILVDFVDSLDFDGKTWLKGEHRIRARADNWDSRKVGLGPPPLKTKDGWLAIYNAVDDLDDRIYQMGAMLLDLKDPTKVLYRTNYPILTPEESYENWGLKYGIVYSCGSAIINNNLYVYYGGSDEYVCAAKAPIDEFIYKLKKTGKPRLQPTCEKVKILGRKNESSYSLFS